MAQEQNSNINLMNFLNPDSNLLQNEGQWVNNQGLRPAILTNQNSGV